MDGPSALRSIHESLQTPPRGGHALLAVLFGSAVALVALIHLLVMHMRRRRKALNNWRDFAARLSGWKLTQAESGLLKNMARKEVLLAPMQIAERADIFERAVHNHLHSVRSSRAGEAEMRREAHKVGSLRRKLALENTVGLRCVSTRQMGTGRKVRIQTKGTVSRGKVGGPRDDLLEVNDLDPPLDLKTGSRVEVTFYERTRSYVARTRVVRSTGSSCLLEHSMEVSVGGSREYHRVDVGGKVSFRATWETGDVRREGKLVDMSAGGMAFLAPCYYKSGEGLLVRVEPQRIAGGNGDPLKERDLPAVVVSTTETDGDECRYHVEFGDLNDDDRAHLQRLVHAIERSRKGN